MKRNGYVRRARGKGEEGPQGVRREEGLGVGREGENRPVQSLKQRCMVQLYGCGFHMYHTNSCIIGVSTEPPCIIWAREGRGEGREKEEWKEDGGGGRIGKEKGIEEMGRKGRRV